MQNHQALEALEELVLSAERGDLYEDYDRGTKLVGEARQAIDHLKDTYDR